MKATQMIHRVGIAMLALALAASAASAEMIYHGLGLNSTVELRTPDMRIYARAGQMRVEVDGQDYKGYCVDIHQSAHTMAAELLPVSTLHNGDKVAFLFDTYADQVDTGSEAAALQVAIWEVLNEADDNSFDARRGEFRVVWNWWVQRLANQMLDALPDAYDGGGDLAVLHSDTFQDILVGGLNEAVPEPATASLIAIGGALALLRRRYRRARG